MLSEKLMEGSELLGAVQQMEGYLSKQQGQSVSGNMALICGEIGGCNGLTPIMVAAQLAASGSSVDLVDADLMGRAFPELQMIVPSIRGKSIAPISCQDEHGAQALLEGAPSEDNKALESKMRVKCVELGMKMAISLCPLKGHELAEYTVLDSYQFAWRIGRCIVEAKARNANPLLALQQKSEEEEMLRKSRIVFYGKIVSIDRKNDGGFSKGTVKLQSVPMAGSAETKYINEERIFVEIQNEYLIVRTEQETLITVPDLIVLFDDEYRAISTEELRYGLRATVMVFPASPSLRTKEALEVVGPGAFGYQDAKYVPIEQLDL